MIANAETVMERPNVELLAECFPDVEIRGHIGPHDTLLSSANGPGHTAGSVDEGRP